MRSKILMVLLVLCCLFKTSFAQQIKNEFFTLHNIIRGDSTYDTFDKQVALIKNSGYAGVEINGEDSFDGMKAALDKYGFHASYFYVKIILDTPNIDRRLQQDIARLKGTRTIISPIIIGNARFPHNTHGADTMVVRLMQQLSDWAGTAGLQVAIYPHLGYYVERTDHALALAKAINKKNVGMTFNLCHWLATTSLTERGQLQSHLKELKPYLKMITISGANDVITQKANVWDDYILPLGTGSFDTYGLLKFCLKELKLTVPIGLQCYNIKTSKYELVKNSIAVWRQYKDRLEAGN